MITHILLLKVASGIDKAAVGQRLGDIAQLAIPGLVSVAVARDLGLRDDNWHYALVCEFHSVEDYRRYDSDPDHGEIKKAIGPMVESIARVQLDLGERISQ